MIPYYSNPTTRAALLAAVARWRGTPFHDHGNVLGVGVDCIHLAANLYTESGHLDTVPVFGPYHLGGGPHSERDLIHAWLDDSPRFRLAWQCRGLGEIAPRPPQMEFGDLVNFRIGRQPWHVGVVLENGRLCEVHQNARVSDNGSIHDATFRRALRAVWRPVTL
jgi:cell wall-associated NlpC family hydrolase